MDLLRLAIAGVLAAAGAGTLVTVVPWPAGLLGLLFQVGAPGLLSLALFALIGAQLQVPDVREVTQLVVGRFRAR